MILGATLINHKPLEYKCSIKHSNQIRVVYLRSRDPNYVNYNSKVEVRRYLIRCQQHSILWSKVSAFVLFLSPRDIRLSS
jgi:hypothetical protein